MLEKTFILLFVTAAVWGSSIPGISVFFPLRSLTLVFLVLMLYKALFLKKNPAIFSHSPDKNAGLRNTTVITFVIMLAVGFITLYWAYSKTAVIIDLVTWFTSFFCIFMSLTYMGRRELLLLSARVYVINFIAIGAIGIYESFTGDYFNLMYEHYLNYRNVFGTYMPSSIMLNINNFAIFIVLSLPVCFIATDGLPAKQLLDYLLMLLGEVIILLTGCNTALILSCVVFAMYVFFHRKRGWTLVVAAVLVAVALTSLSVVANVFNEIAGFSVGDEPRFAIWDNALGVSARYNFMGVGPGNSAIVNLIYKTNLQSVSVNNHNYLLTVLEEFGVVGCAAFCFWLWRLYAVSFGSFRKRYDSINKYFIIFLVIYLPSTVCMSTMVGYYYPWLIFGMLMAHTARIEGEHNE